MWSNTINLIILIFLYLLSLIFTLILFYSNPTSIAEVFIGSLYFLPFSFVALAVAFKVDFSVELNNYIKYAYIALYTLMVLFALNLTLIALYANPNNNVEDGNMGGAILGLSTFIILISLITILTKRKNEK